MAKFKEKIKARILRKKGESIKEIANTLKISKSTISLWCRDIKLSSLQIERLNKKMIDGGYKGRMIGAKIQKDRKNQKINYYNEKGINDTRKINSRNLLMLGLGLHIGEGNKKSNQFQFTNSDPKIIKIILFWLKKIFNINKKDIYCNIIINKIHKNRIEEVQKAWSKTIGIPQQQFNKTVLIKAKNKKVYENMNSHLGTLTLRVKKSSELQYRIIGLIYGLLNNIIQ